MTMPEKKPEKAKPKPKKAAQPQAHSLEKGVQNFGEEMERLGEKIEAVFEKKGKEWESWFQSTFGIIGPLISSVLGLVVLAFIIWVMMLINIPVQSGVLSNVQYFFLSNMGLIFLIFMFFAYSSYFSKVNKAAYRPFAPLVTAVGILIGFWFAANVIRISNMYLGIGWLTSVASLVEILMLPIFWLALLLGYAIIIVNMSTGGKIYEWSEDAGKALKKKPRAKGGIHRLYRSGRERIIAGVCGGIAEYMNIDPTIIRLLWIILTLASMGFGGVLLYIILWIVIPRNPNHRWD